MKIELKHTLTIKDTEITLTTEELVALANQLNSLLDRPEEKEEEEENKEASVVNENVSYTYTTPTTAPNITVQFNHAYAREGFKIDGISFKMER